MVRARIDLFSGKAPDPVELCARAGDELVVRQRSWSWSVSSPYYYVSPRNDLKRRFLARANELDE